MMASVEDKGPRHEEEMLESGVKMMERKYIIPPDEDSEDDEDDAEEVTLGEMEVDEPDAGGGDDPDVDEVEDLENMELLEVGTERGEVGNEEASSGVGFNPDEVLEVELLEMSTGEVDLGGDKSEVGVGVFDPDEDTDDALVIDEEIEGEGVQEVKEKKRESPSEEWLMLEMLPPGWKFKETPRHNGGKKVFLEKLKQDANCKVFCIKCTFTDICDGSFWQGVPLLPTGPWVMLLKR